MSTKMLDSIIRSLEHKRNYLLAGIILYIRAMVEQHHLSRRVLLERALEHVQRIRRRFAEQGDAGRWRRAGDIERVISAEIGRW